MAVENFFPEARQSLLRDVEAFFVEQLRFLPNCEAIVHFASSLRKKNPKDIDFFVVSDDPRLFAAEHWESWEFGDYYYKKFQLDFFFRIDSFLDPNSIESIRASYKANFDKAILQNLRNGERCVVYTRPTEVDKYLEAFPGSVVIIV